MRILFVVNDLGNGGLERQLTLLATSLPRGWEPRVWAMGGGPFASRLLDEGIPVVVRRRRVRFDPLPALDLWRELRSWRPDVVHAWGWMPALAAGPMCRLLSIACVDGMIRSGMLEPDFTLLKRLGMAFATLVVANSRAGLRAWGVGPNKGRVVYNAFDPARLQPPGDGPAAGRATFTVIMTGRMNPAKRFDMMIETAGTLSQADGGWRFVLVGDGPDRERLVRRGAGLVERGILSFPRPRMEVLGLVRHADVGVLMTNERVHSEGLSNSIMEYMALGLPVVCGDGGGTPELVEDGVTGFVIPPGDVGALADRLTILRDDGAAAAAMGRRGRDKILHRFSVERMVADTVAVYTEALTKRRGRRVLRASQSSSEGSQKARS